MWWGLERFWGWSVRETSNRAGVEGTLDGMDIMLKLGMDESWVEVTAEGVRGSPFFGHSREQVMRTAVTTILMQLAIEVDSGKHEVENGFVLRVVVAEE